MESHNSSYLQKVIDISHDHVPIGSLKNCLYCNKLFRGRADKKFCTEFCRNAYNNDHARLPANSTFKVINKILKRNREILCKLEIQEYQVVEVSKEQLVRKGFEFQFLTRCVYSSNGEVYHFCYEFAYAFNGDMCIVGKGKTLLL
jgi:hypothetical protein